MTAVLISEATFYEIHYSRKKSMNSQTCQIHQVKALIYIYFLKVKTLKRALNQSLFCNKARRNRLRHCKENVQYLKPKQDNEGTNPKLQP